MKSNVTNIRPITGGLPHLVFTDDELIGWLIYRPDTDEFLHSFMVDDGYSIHSYVKEPCLAYRFFSESLAKFNAKHIDKQTEIVPLFDHNDKLIVGFSKKRFIS